MEDKNRDTEIDDREPLAWSMIHCPQDNIYMITTTLLLKFHLYDVIVIIIYLLYLVILIAYKMHPYKFVYLSSWLV